VKAVSPRFVALNFFRRKLLLLSLLLNKLTLAYGFLVNAKNEIAG
jgi:hypothetical protein